MSRLSLPTLIVLGVIGPGAAWSAPDVAATPESAAAAVKPLLPADLRARIIELRIRQQGDPKNPAIPYQLGALYLDLGDPVAAEEQLRKAVDLGNTRSDLWPLLARAWLQRGKYAEIQTEIPADQLAGSQDKAAVAVVQGLAWLAEERPDEARKRFQDALALEPDYSPAYVGLARVSIARKNLAAAADALVSAADGRAGDPAEVAALRGDVAAAAKDFAAAEAAYQQAAEAKPYQVWRLRPLAEMQIAGGKLDAADATLARLREVGKPDQTILYLEGLSAILRGDYQRAADTVAPVLGGNIGEPRVFLVAGTAAYKLAQYQQARQSLEIFLKHQPDNQDARRLMGATLVRLGEPKEALEYVLPLVQAPNPSVADLLLAGSAAVVANDPKAGLGYLERVLAIQPDNQDLRQLIAAVKAAGGDARALEKLVAEGATGLSDLELGLLQRSVRAGDYTKVLTGARRFQQRYPNQPEGWVYEGIALARTGGPSDAANSAFERALSLSPGNLDALIGLAALQSSAGNHQGAHDTIVKALKISPGNPLLLDNLITIAIAEGKPEGAIELIKPLVAAAPQDLALAAALARAYRSAGQPLVALEFLAGRPDAQTPGLRREKGLAERRAGRLAAAVATFRQLAEDAPQSAQAQVDLAQATEEGGDAVAAGRIWDKAAHLEPANGEARIGQARAALLSLSAPVEPAKVKRAIEQAAEAVRQNPRAPGAQELQATVMILFKQPQAAAEHLEPVYAGTLEPFDVLLLSRAYLHANDKTRSLTVLRDHAQRFPGDIRVRMELARLYLADGQTSPAVAQLSAIVAQDWQNSEAQVQLALVLIKTGRREAALPHLGAAAQALPGDERVKEMQTLVRQSPPATGTAKGQ